MDYNVSGTFLKLQITTCHNGYSMKELETECKKHNISYGTRVTKKQLANDILGDYDTFHMKPNRTND